MSPLQGVNCMVYDDNDANSQLMRLYLRRAGAMVHVLNVWPARDPFLCAIRSVNDLQVLLLDLMLPNAVTGYDVHRWIRDQPDLDALRVILVTAASPDRERPQAMRLGLDGYIEKPLRAGQFAAQVASVLDGSFKWGIE